MAVAFQIVVDCQEKNVVLYWLLRLEIWTLSMEYSYLAGLTRISIRSFPAENIVGFDIEGWHEHILRDLAIWRTMLVVRSIKPCGFAL